MPMNPSDYNSQSEFMGACVSDMSDSHPDWEKDRVVAACTSMWGKEKRARAPVLKQAPTPQAGEAQEDFMARCTALAMKENPDWDAAQADQACSTIWAGDKKNARVSTPKESEVLSKFMNRCTLETASANPGWDAGKIRSACSGAWAEKRLGKNGKRDKQDDGEGAIPDPNEYDSKEEFMSDCMDATGDRTACEQVWEDESGEERKGKAPVRKSRSPAKQIPGDATDPNDYDDYNEYMAACVEQIGDEEACDTWWNEKRIKGPVRKTRSTTGKIDKEGVEFILSDESVDRMGDVIIANGWKLDNFRRNPVALFNHKADFVVGKWDRLRVDGDKLRGHLRFAPAGTSPRIDEIRKLVEAGILQAVSVGFAPIGSPEPRVKNNMPTGFTYRGQELIETSLVSVPANPNALAVAKSLRISPRTIDIVFAGQGKKKTAVVPSRGSSGGQAETHPAPKGVRTMSVLSKRIEDTQARIVGLRDQLTEHLSNVDDSNVTDADLAVTEELNKKIALQIGVLDQFKDSEARLGGESSTHAIATKGNGHGGNGADLTTRRPFNIAPKKVNPLEYLVRSGVVAFFHQTQKEPIDIVRQKIYGDDEATKAIVDWTLKANSAPAMTSVAGWAAELVQQVNADLMATLQPASVFPRLSALGVMLTFGRNGRISVPTRLTTPTIAGSFIGEGQPIPVRQGAFTAVLMTPKKMGVITTWTREIDEHSVPAIEGLLRQAIQEDTAISLDTVLLDANPATVVRPAGLRNGVASLTPTAGGGFDALVGDIKKISGSLLTATAGNIRSMVWLMNPQQALSISLTQAPSAVGIFPFAAEIAAGNLRGWPVIQSGTVPVGTVIALDAADFVSVSGDTPRFEVSDQATLHMEDTTPLPLAAAGTPGTVAAPQRSLWQTDSLALRLILPVNWAVRRAGTVAYIDAVTW